jgi:hypothetical protein
VRCRRSASVPKAPLNARRGPAAFAKTATLTAPIFYLTSADRGILVDLVGSLPFSYETCQLV